MNRRKLIGLLGVIGLFTIPGFPKNNQLTRRKENKKVKMKTIGILGGVGPQATMEIEKQLHHVSQKLVAPFYNTGYPPMMVCYHRDAPFIVNGDQPVFPLQPNLQLLECAKKLGTLVDFIIIPSNGVHMIQKEIETASGCKVLSMVDFTIEKVTRRSWKHVGVLGFKKAFVYTKRLNAMGITTEIIDGDLLKRLDTAVMRTMEGRERDEDRATAREAIQYLRSKNVDGIIPGCTELPLLLADVMSDPDILNPSELLAEAAIRFALD